MKKYPIYFEEVSSLQPNESLYDQKPEEPAPDVTSTDSSTATFGSSFPSRFEYMESIPAAENIPKGAQVIGHVGPPKSSSFFAEFGMDSGFSKKPVSTTKVQVRVKPFALLFMVIF